MAASVVLVTGTVVIVKLALGAGHPSANFTITTVPVTSTTDDAIHALLRGIDKRATLEVRPPPQPDLIVHVAFFTDANGNQIDKPVPGNAFKLFVNVLNNGAGAAEASEVRVLITASDGTITLDETKAVTALQPNK